MSRIVEIPSNLARNSSALPSRSALYVEEGTVQALKWVALVLMIVDHANKYLASGKIEWMFAAGRLSLPVFCFVLAYNLNRPGALTDGSPQRVMKRTALSGWIATPFFILLGGLGWGWWPLNVMFMFFVVTWIILLLERRRRGDLARAVGVFLIGGALVEYWWIGLALFLATRRYRKCPGAMSIALLVLSTATLYIINGNFWALAAVPLITLSRYVHEVPMPRWRNVFYIMYPAHLAVLSGVRWWFALD